MKELELKKPIIAHGETLSVLEFDEPTGKDVRELGYVVQGWRQGNGTLWQPNQRVIVFDPVCGFDNTELLVSEVTFTQDQNGTLTEIRVGPPDAYLPEPEAPGARKKKKARVQEDPF